mgnify:CR=1 FL=1
MLNYTFGRSLMNKAVILLAFAVPLIISGCAEEKSKPEQVRDALHSITKIPEKVKKMDSTINETAKQAVIIAKEIEESAPSKQRKHPRDTTAAN